MPSNAIVETSKSPATETEAVVRRWLVIFCSLFGRDLSKLLVATWCELLKDRDAALMDRACERLAKMPLKFLPVPGDVIAQIDGAEGNALKLEAEEEWGKALDFSVNHWHPDIGFSRNAPQLSPVTWHALNAAGGLSHLFNCSRDELQWARRRFLEDFHLCHQNRKVQDLIGEGEAKRILRLLDAGSPAERRQLTTELEVNPPHREEVRAVLAKVAEPRPAYQPAKRMPDAAPGESKKNEGILHIFGECE